jgi:hypothetical protein
MKVEFQNYGNEVVAFSLAIFIQYVLKGTYMPHW